MVFATCKSAAAGALAVLALAAPSAAQSPTGLSNQKPASEGKTDVATEGFQTAPERAAEEESKDGSHLKLSAGGFLSGGNSRTISYTASADYSIRRSDSQFTVLAAANYGRSAPEDDGPLETTVENYQGRLRYDYFVTSSIAAFLVGSARNDRFQGLNLRLNIGPGLAYYFIDEKEQGFWVELGYDFQYDFRDPDYIDGLLLADPTLSLPEKEKRHNVRAFVGYDNQMAEAVTFSTGLEYLQNVEAAENARLNFDAALAVQINQAFAVAVTVSLKYDNNPLPGVEDTDLVTALNLVYTMD